jgi:hypothetical protein
MSLFLFSLYYQSFYLILYASINSSLIFLPHILPFRCLQTLSRHLLVAPRTNVISNITFQDDCRVFSSSKILTFLPLFVFESLKYVQCDQKENKSEQALQIIGHVAAEFYANKRSMHGRRKFVVLNATL